MASERLFLNPSVQFQLSEHPSYTQVKFYFKSGRKCIEVRLNDVAEKVVKETLTAGFPCEGRAFSTSLPNALQQLAEALHSRGMLVGSEGDPMEWPSSMRWLDRQLRYLCSLPELAASPVTLQDRLSDARVCVVGLGGTGSGVVQQLAMMGIGSLTLIDPDTVEPTNLNRQPIYSLSDTGRAKSEVAAEWVRERVPGARAMPLQAHLSDDSACNALNSVNTRLIINCADSPSLRETTRQILSLTSCSIPVLVGGGYFLSNGIVGPLITAGQTACLDCEGGDTVSTDNFGGGNIAPIATLLSSLAAFAAFEFLLTGTSDLANNQLVVTLSPAQIKQRALKANSSCITCLRN